MEGLRVLNDAHPTSSTNPTNLRRRHHSQGRLTGEQRTVLGDDFLELVDELHNTGSMIITSNRAPTDWYGLFRNPVTALRPTRPARQLRTLRPRGGPEVSANKRPGAPRDRHCEGDAPSRNSLGPARLWKSHRSGSGGEAWEACGERENRGQRAGRTPSREGRERYRSARVACER
jgi:hypothetical protein